MESSNYLFEKDLTVNEKMVGGLGTIKLCELQNAFVNTATEHCKLFGVDIDSLQTKGLSWVISKIRIKIFSLPKLGDVLTIKTWPIKSGKLVFDRDFQVVVNGKTVAIASSRWCVIDLKTRKPVKAEFVNAFLDCITCTTIIKDPFSNVFEKFNNYKTNTHIVCEAEIDINHHLNNAKYYDLAFEALGNLDNMSGQIGEVFLHYHKEALIGDKIVLKSCIVGNTYYVFGVKDGNDNDVIFEFNAIAN